MKFKLAAFAAVFAAGCASPSADFDMEAARDMMRPMPEMSQTSSEALLPGMECGRDGRGSSGCEPQ